MPEARISCRECAICLVFPALFLNVPLARGVQGSVPGGIMCKQWNRAILHDELHEMPGRGAARVLCRVSPDAVAQRLL